MKDMLIYNLNSRLDRIQKRLEATKQQSSGDLSNVNNRLGSAESALSAIIKELNALRAEVDQELADLEANLPNVFRDLILPLTSQIDNLSSIASQSQYLSALARIDTVLYSTEPVMLEWNLNHKRYHATINVAGRDPDFLVRPSIIMPGDAVLIRCILPAQGDNPPTQAYLAAMLISPPPSLSTPVEGCRLFRLANQADAAAVGRIRLSGLSAAEGNSPAKHPTNYDFIPPSPVMGPDAPMPPEQQPIARYSLVTYKPPQIFGKNIYIQSNEPTDPDCVWIDTAGIDLIQE